MANSTVIVPFAELIWYTMGLNKNYNELHEEFRDAVRKYADWEEQGFVPKEVCMRLISLLLVL